MIKAESGKLRAFLDATHEHADIRDARTKRIGGVVTDARKQGFDGKALRKVFVRERMQPEKLQGCSLASNRDGRAGGSGSQSQRRPQVNAGPRPACRKTGSDCDLP